MQLSNRSTRLRYGRLRRSLNHHFRQAARALGPALLALTFATAAHAQGTMDLSGARTLMGTFSTRFAYVSVSRASHDAQIYTNDAEALGQRLSHDASKSSAIAVRQQAQVTQKGKSMDNDAQQGLRPDNPGLEAIKERVYTPAEHECHYAPLNRELHADDARQFGWTAENGMTQSYQNTGTRRHIHIDGPSGQFYDQQKNPITQTAALDGAVGVGVHHASKPELLTEFVHQQQTYLGL